MNTDDSAAQNFDSIEGFDPGGRPMSGIGASANPVVAVFYHRKDILGVPHLILRVIGAPGVLMNRRADIELFDQLLDDVQIRYFFGGNRIKIQFFGELENLSPLGFTLGAHDAVIHRANVMLRELLFDLRNGLFRSVVVPFYRWLFGAQFLAGIKLDQFASSLGGLVDRLKDGETVESPGLATDAK